MKQVLAFLVLIGMTVAVVYVTVTIFGNLDRLAAERYENEKAIRLLRIEKGHTVRINGKERHSAVFVSTRFTYAVSIDGGPEFDYTPSQFGQNKLP